MNNLIDCLNSLCTLDVTCVLTGDLNCACIDWINSSCNDPIQQLFLDAVSDLGFLQFVDKPTRENNILDLVLCSDPLLIVDVMSQHHLVQVIILLLNFYLICH